MVVRTMRPKSRGSKVRQGAKTLSRMGRSHAKKRRFGRLIWIAVIGGFAAVLVALWLTEIAAPVREKIDDLID